VARPQPLTPEEEALLPDVEMDRIAFMLLGIAIEALAKGILVGRNPACVQNGELDGQLKSHDLENLVKRCGISVDGEDRFALDILTEHVVWMGRYHIPTNAERVARLSTKRKLLLARSDDSLDDVYVFGERLVEQLDTLCDEEHVVERAAARTALAREEIRTSAPKPGATR
jgi:hypothetical protein